MIIGVIGGDGRWGSALANLSKFGGNETTCYCLPEGKRRIEQNRVIPFSNKVIEIHPNITFATEPTGMKDCDIVFIAVPGKQLLACWQQWKAHIK